jgi:murein L,D-transpeptidase YcbB/YkuD
MTMKQGFAFTLPGRRVRTSLFALAALSLVAGGHAIAQGADAPEDLLPGETTPEAVLPQAQPDRAPAKPATAADDDPIATVIKSEPVVQDIPNLNPVMDWSLADARALLGVIEGIAAEGLIPADYRPDALRAALAAGPGDGLNAAASQSFTWLVEDLRDGRTPVKSRVQWFALDPDRERMPTEALMEKALETGDIPGVLGELTPTYPDYLALKEALANTPESNKAKRALIQANMDRWRWLARDLGHVYLLTNVPEFELRLMVKDKVLRTYRTVVGKPGRSATPQLAETVEAVVFNPTWTVPQSIVKGEGLGARVLGNPGWARANGYKATKGANGWVTVVQQPGPGNALGLMKIDMPNPHAIYLHDTPSKSYFNHDVRAYSHGCIRTERAVELGMTMAILGADMSPEEAAAKSRARQYERVKMTKTFPVYLTYMTMGRDIDGTLRAFKDIYGRDKPVLDSFAQPRKAKTEQRVSDEEIIELDNPL